jgi:hypothetical protein
MEEFVSANKNRLNEKTIERFAGLTTGGKIRGPVAPPEVRSISVPLAVAMTRVEHISILDDKGNVKDRKELKYSDTKEREQQLLKLGLHKTAMKQSGQRIRRDKLVYEQHFDVFDREGAHIKTVRQQYTAGEELPDPIPEESGGAHFVLRPASSGLRAVDLKMLTPLNREDLAVRLKASASYFAGQSNMKTTFVEPSIDPPCL